MAGPIRVLYVMGLGRSGSTVLDSILGNHPSFVGLGELRYLVGPEGIRKEYCACGEPVRECPFWSEVVARWRDLTGGAKPAELWAAQREVERTRNWRGLSADRPRPEAGFARYAELTRALLEAIRQAGGQPGLVDSSKLPARALALSRIDGVDLRAVHLVRDGRGVAWSLKKKLALDPRGGVSRHLTPRTAVRTAARWWFVNSLSERVAERLGPERVRRIRYEDFVTDPVTALTAIGEMNGVDLGDLARRAAAGDDLATHHAVAGNRLRMAGTVRLRLDTDWMTKLPEHDQRVFRLAARRPLRRYGYLD
jgi:Sulfotransferase family